MGARAATIWYVDAPDPGSVLRDHRDPDADAAIALARQLFPDSVVVPRPVGPLSTSAGVGDRGLYIGCYPGVTVVCSTELAVARPSRLPAEFVRPFPTATTVYVGFDPARSWGAYALWERGTVRRCFSATAVHILEDEGLPQVWERPYWAGEHPLAHEPGIVPDPASLPFDPQDLADAANERILGFRYRNAPEKGPLDPAGIVVCGFELYGRDEPLPADPAPRPQPRQQQQQAAASKRSWFRRRR